MSKTVGIAFFKSSAPPPPPPSPPLDPYSANLVVAYGLKRWLTSYTGPLIRVRRDSDNTEQDINYISGTGIIDTASLLGFVGSGNGYVTTWYDQSVNSVNATQSTAAYQPIIVSSGTYIGKLGFDGTNDTLASAMPASGLYTFAARFQVPGIPSAPASFVSTTFPASTVCWGVQYQTDDATINIYSVNGGFTDYWNVDYSFSVAEDANLFVINYGSSDPGTPYYRNSISLVNTTTHVGTTGHTYSALPIYLASSGSSQYTAMTFTNLIVWTVDQSANQAAISAIL